MKRISLHRIGQSAWKSAARFPLVLVFAAVAAAAGVILIHDGDSAWLQKLLLTAQLGIPLVLAVAIATEPDSFPGRSTVVAWLGQGAAGLLLTAYFFSLPTSLSDANFVRHIQLNLAAHLAVAVLPFLRPGKNNAFWQFNLGLALRFLAALFFSHVLFGGLSVALFALDALLGIHVDESVYPRLWVVIVFLFNTWYFMTGIPERPSELDSVNTLPPIVRVFAQFILAPLVVVYLGILSAYLVKVLVTAEWPSGQIGYLVSSVAVAGIFSLLLLYPLSVRPEVRWVRVYARIYYILLVPAVAMLLMAIFKRIGQYGVTENRYLLTVMAFWLAGVVVAGAFRGRPFLKIIPATLAAVALLTAFGPLSAAQMSRRSQLGRLDAWLASNERLVDGRIVASATGADEKEGAEIGSILIYLFDNHGSQVLGVRAEGPLQESLNQELKTSPGNHVPALEMANLVARHANLPLVQGGSPGSRTTHQVLREVGPHPFSLGDYDFLVELEFPRDQERTLAVGTLNLRLTLAEGSSDLIVVPDDAPGLEFGLLEHLSTMVENGQLMEIQDAAPDSLMRISVENADLGLLLLLDSVHWEEEVGGAGVINSLKGVLLVELKE